MFLEFLEVSTHVKSGLLRSASPKPMLFNSQANAMTLEELLERRQQVKDCLSPLVEKSKELAVQSEIRAKNYANLSLQMISERADMYEKLKIHSLCKYFHELLPNCQAYETGFLDVSPYC